MEETTAKSPGALGATEREREREREGGAENYTGKAAKFDWKLFFSDQEACYKNQSLSNIPQVFKHFQCQ